MTLKRDRHIPDLISLRQAAEILKTSKQAAHKRVLKGDFPGAQVDGTWIFRRSVVEAARIGNAPTAEEDAKHHEPADE